MLQNHWKFWVGVGLTLLLITALLTFLWRPSYGMAAVIVFLSANLVLQWKSFALSQRARLMRHLIFWTGLGVGTGLLLLQMR